VPTEGHRGERASQGGLRRTCPPWPPRSRAIRVERAEPPPDALTGLNRLGLTGLLGFRLARADRLGLPVSPPGGRAGRRRRISPFCGDDRVGDEAEEPPEHQAPGGHSLRPRRRSRPAARDELEDVGRRRGYEPIGSLSLPVLADDGAEEGVRRRPVRAAAGPCRACGTGASGALAEALGALCARRPDDQQQGESGRPFAADVPRAALAKLCIRSHPAIIMDRSKRPGGGRAVRAASSPTVAAPGPKLRADVAGGHERSIRPAPPP